MWKVPKCVDLDIIHGNKCNKLITSFQHPPNDIIYSIFITRDKVNKL